MKAESGRNLVRIWLPMAAAVGLAWLAGRHHPPVAAERHARDDGDAEKVSALQDGLARMERRLDRVQTQVVARERGPVEAPAPASSPAPSLEERRRMARAANERLRETIAGAFANQPRDAAWAREFEPKLQSALTTAVGQNGRVDEIACAQTLCRATLTFDSADQRHETTGELGALPELATEAFYFHADAGGRSVTTIYLARERQPLTPMLAQAMGWETTRTGGGE